MNRLSGKTAAITGGDQGIGRAIVERLAQEGADIAFCYRKNKSGADEVSAAITALGRKSAAIQCDVGNIAEGQSFITQAISQLGKIDILVNNAGLERRANFWEVTEADYDAVLNVSLKGVFFITQAFVNHRKRWSSDSWQEYLAAGATDAEVAELRQCTHTGRPLGTREFVHSLEQVTQRRLAPQKGGRYRSALDHRAQTALPFEK